MRVARVQFGGIVRPAGKAGASYSLINRAFQRGRDPQSEEAAILPQTVPKREFKPKIEPKSILRNILQVSHLNSIFCRKSGGH